MSLTEHHLPAHHFLNVTYRTSLSERHLLNITDTSLTEHNRHITY